MIEIKDLQKCFGEKKAVDVSEYSIRRADLLGLVGNNGAGKTTLFRLMLDLLKADGGEVVYRFDDPQGEDGKGLTVNPAESEVWKAHVGSYIDEGFLIDFLTPEEYFAFIGKVSGMNAEETEQRIADFETFMAGEIVGHKKLIRNLSAGNKQKVGIVAAMFNKPQVLILDEPFNFLDPSSQNILKQILVNFNRENGSTILVSSHNLAHTVDICPRIALMENGSIIRDLDNKDGQAQESLQDYFKA